MSKGQSARVESIRTTDVYLARWKKVARPRRDVRYRAICGRPGCPGSLGLLENVGMFKDATAGVHSARHLESFEDLDRLLAGMEERIDLPSEMDREKLLASFAALRAAVGRHRAAAEELQRAVAAAFRELAKRPDIWDLIPDWAMRPEKPHRERRTPPDRSPQPIYFGHSDTGYRISLGGKRSRDGQRIGRRDRQKGPTEAEISSIVPGFSDSRSATGQLVVPPCRIFCPVCGAINDVGVPPGFTVEETCP